MNKTVLGRIMLIVGLALIVIANVIDRARTEPLERPRYHDPYRDIRPPNVACPDQQTLDEVEAMRRMGDREGEAITRRSYGCVPVLRSRPGPFER
jgi:hypothetical protein